MAAVGLGSGRPGLALAAITWGAVQAGGTAFGVDARRLVGLKTTVRRAELVAIGALLIHATTDAMSPVTMCALGAFVGFSLALRALAMRLRQHVAPPRRILVLGRTHQLRASPSYLDHASANVAILDIVTGKIAHSQSTVHHEAIHQSTRHADVVMLLPTHLLCQRILRHAPDEVVVLPGALTGDQVQELSWTLEPYDVELVLSLPADGIIKQRMNVVTRSHGSGVAVRPSGRTHAEPVRRVFDIMIAAIGILVVSPLMAVIAIVIRLDSAGPALFVQQRIGRDGRAFAMLKFRSMRVDAETMLDQLRTANEVAGDVMFKMKRDPRVTRAGRLLRATSLDELPQLFNVLAGHMSMIGPRPALPAEVAAYDDRARRRLAVRPGLTGLWQVSGRSNLSFDDAVRLDVDYIVNWSARRELEIAARTFKAVATREGAY